MAKPEWGVKRICPECATRFYDLTRDPATCPKCEASFSAASLTKGKPVKATAKAAAAGAAADDDAEVVVDDADIVVDDDDAVTDDDSDEVTVVADDDDDDVDLGTQIEIETDKEDED